MISGEYEERNTRVYKSALTSASALLFRDPNTLLAESLKCRLFRISPLELRVVLEFFIALRLGL